MSIKILQYPDKRLRRRGYYVGNIKATKIQKCISNMTETLLNAKNCLALAATQLDIESPPSIVVFNKNNFDSTFHKDGNAIFCLINPEIISKKNYIDAEEGCMSISDYNQNPIYMNIKRADKIKVKGIDTAGNILNFSAEGYFARCIQHECDHLNGVLIIDYLDNSFNNIVKNKIFQKR